MGENIDQSAGGLFGAVVEQVSAPPSNPRRSARNCSGRLRLLCTSYTLSEPPDRIIKAFFNSWAGWKHAVPPGRSAAGTGRAVTPRLLQAEGTGGSARSACFFVLTKSSSHRDQALCDHVGGDPPADQGRERPQFDGCVSFDRAGACDLFLALSSAGALPPVALPQCRDLRRCNSRLRAGGPSPRGR